MSDRVFRFAPSPNGPLHLGHALSALLNHDMAARVGGRFRLRIDDIDAGRARPSFEAQILDDLAWLGCRWETPIRRQSLHHADYRTALARLAALNLLKRTYATRREISAGAAAAAKAGRPWATDPDGAPAFPGDEAVLPAAEIARRVDAGAAYAVRLDMAAALGRIGTGLTWPESDPEEGAAAVDVVADPARWGDVVLARKDAPASYTLAVVVDDAAEGVTDIVRGQDLFEATAVQRVLQTLLGLPVPTYHHHRLILGADGKKLSKSAGAAGLSALRAARQTAGDVRRLVGLGPAPAGDRRSER